MLYRYLILISLLSLGSTALDAQTITEQMATVEQSLAQLELEKQRLQGQLEDLKLQKIQADLREIGLPGEESIMHNALALEYAEEHEQARWVAHIILPDIIDRAGSFRSNDFRRRSRR